MNDNPRYVILKRKLGKANARQEVVGFENDSGAGAGRVMAGRDADNGYWFWMREARPSDAR